MTTAHVFPSSLSLASGQNRFDALLGGSPLKGMTGLNPALAKVQTWLQQVAASSDWRDRLAVAFGNEFDPAILSTLTQDWLTGTFSTLPSIAIRPAYAINGADGAFAATTNTIYLAEELLAQSIPAPQRLVEVLLEEIGHAVDARINATDSPGDEGAIFATLVQGRPLDEPTLQPLRTEDDTVVLTLDGQRIALEQSTPGVNPAFDLIGLTQLRNDPQFAGIDGSGFSVAVIDSRVDTAHPLLQPNLRDFVNFTNSPIPDAHGTHVAGTVGATDPNISVAPAVGLIGLNVFPSDPNVGAQTDTIVRSLRWVLDNYRRYNITAVNMSLGGGFYSSREEALGEPELDLISRLERVGVTVVSAGGNSFKERETPNFSSPAIYSTLAVGAVWQDGVNRNQRWGSGAVDRTTGSDRIVSFSQRLAAPNTLFAPGALIRSTIPGGRIGLQAGTSMASPIVAGAVALLQEAAQLFGGRVLTPAEVVDILRSTADQIFDGDDEDDNVRNTNISYPRLNIYKAVTEVRRRFQQAAPTGDSNGTIQGALPGPRLDGSPVAPLLEEIGADGGAPTVGNRDVDLFRFEVLSPGQVTLEVGSHPQNPVDFDSYLRLFDASGQEIAVNDDIQTEVNLFSRITTDLAPGTYYAGVSGFENNRYNPTVAGSGTAGATGRYSLQLSLSNVDPNGLISGAVPITFDRQEPVLRGGSIGFDFGRPVGVSDVDLFRIQVPDNGTLFVDIDTPFNPGEFVDSYLRIFDADGNELVFSDDDLATDDGGNPIEFTDSRFSGSVFDSPTNRRQVSGHTTDSFIAGTVERGDVYYIGVSDFFNQSYNPNQLSNRAQGGTGGLYNLAVTFINNDQDGSIPQISGLSTIPLPTTRRAGVIGADTSGSSRRTVQVGDRDVDFYRVRSRTASILDIDIDSSASTGVRNPVDTVALLFDRNGNFLASNDDTDSFDPRLQYRIAPNTDYYVAITGYGSEDFNPFQLGSGSAGDTGSYFFTSRLLPLAQTRTLTDDVISNRAVQRIRPGSVVSAYVGEDNSFTVGAADVDLYRLTPTVTGTIDIQVQSVESYSADTFLRVFNANGVQLAANDNESDATRGSFLRLPVIAGRTYFVGVNGTSRRAGNYNPRTGRGAVPGSQGAYTLVVSAAGASRTQSTLGTSTWDALTGQPTTAPVRGSDGPDRLTGGAGDDDLLGGAGNDRLTSGSGSDRFIFNHPRDGVDTLTDFSVMADTIGVAARSFGAGLQTGQAIDPAQFRIGAGARDGDDRFIYNPLTGRLSFDRDGSGQGLPILLAQMPKELPMTHLDIVAI